MNEYGIEFVRLYQHINDNNSIMLIKFIDGELMKVRFPNIIGEVGNGNNKKNRRKTRKNRKRN